MSSRLGSGKGKWEKAKGRGDERVSPRVSAGAPGGARVRSGAGRGVVHPFGRRGRAEREQGGDVRAVALRAEEYFAQDAGASDPGVESAGGVEITRGAVAAVARPGDGGPPGGEGAEAKAERAEAEGDQKAVRRTQAAAGEDA